MQGEGEELEPSAVVLRVVPDRAHFLPLGKGTPAVLAVQPSGTEKADAKATGKPVRISVFDQARTSAAQAIALREAFKEGPYLAFQLQMSDAAAVGGKVGVLVRAIRESDPDLADRAGADGHCGLEGLHESSPDSSKTKAKSIREEIVRCLVRVG